MNTASAPALVLAARGLAEPGHVLTLATRPHTQVVHLYSGPLTPSGRFAAAAARPVCGTRTRRLTVFARDLGLLDHGRRLCARCTARLSPVRAVQPVSRDEWLAAYRGTTLGDLALMLAVASTSDETHRIGFIAQLLFGPPPVRRPQELSARQAYYDLHAALLTVRRRLVAAERTPEEIEAARLAREVEAHNDAIAVAGRKRAARLERLQTRAARGQYLTGPERAEIGMTG